MRTRLLLAAVVALLAAPAHALTVRALSADEVVALAARVVHARCLAVTAGPPRAGVPTVEITLAVDETLKGDAAERLVVRQLGGRFAALLPAPRPGDEVVLFLHAPSRLGLTSPVGLGQGMLRVVRDEAGGTRVLGDPRIVDAFAPSGHASAVQAGAAGRASGAVSLEAVLTHLRQRLGSPR